MEAEVVKALQTILLRFNGMTFNEETLNYMEMEVNDAMGRLFPDFNKEYYIIPWYNQQTRAIKFLPTRKH